MDAQFLLKGLILGLSIAAPVGPIGILVIRRTMVRGRVSGLASGLGAATADAIYGIVAGFGLTVVADALARQRVLLELVGGGFLCYLGVKTCLTRPADRGHTDESTGWWRSYASALFLTLTNPMTILSFAGAFAGLGIASARRGLWTAASLVAGVFAGSALWWLLLTSVVQRLRSRFSGDWLLWINRIAGLVLTGFGIRALLGILTLIRR